MLEPGIAAAAGKRNEAQVQDKKWRRAGQAMLLSERNVIRRGFAMLE